MTVPLLSEVEGTCPDCNGHTRVPNPDGPITPTMVPCPRCEGRGTVLVLFFICPTCEGTGEVDDPLWGTAKHPMYCDDPNHSLHGPVTLARLEPYGWSREAGPQPSADRAGWNVFRKVAEWQAP